jgi:Recombinase
MVSYRYDSFRLLTAPDYSDVPDFIYVSCHRLTSSPSIQLSALKAVTVHAFRQASVLVPSGPVRPSTPIRYRTVISVLKNPFYAGAYVYGKSEKRTAIVDGRPHKTYGHGKPFDEWEVMIKEHHEGYIDWPSSNGTKNNSLPILTVG